MRPSGLSRPDGPRGLLLTSSIRAAADTTARNLISPNRLLCLPLPVASGDGRSRRQPDVKNHFEIPPALAGGQGRTPETLFWSQGSPMGAAGPARPSPAGIAPQPANQRRAASRGHPPAPRAGRRHGGALALCSVNASAQGVPDLRRSSRWSDTGVPQEQPRPAQAPPPPQLVPTATPQPLLSHSALPLPTPRTGRCSQGTP